MPLPKLILDTTFALPLFGIGVDLPSQSEKEIQEMWRIGIPNYELYLPSVCILEVGYKLNAEFRQKKNPEILNRMVLALPTLLTHPLIKIFHPHTNLAATDMAMRIRNQGHSVLMDCWIAASAYALDGVFLTEEGALIDILKTIPEFTTVAVWSWNKLQSEMKK